MTKPLFQWFNQRQPSLCHRQLLRIVGNRTWASETIAQLLAEQDDVLWIGEEAEFVPDHHTIINNKAYRQHLGLEYNHVVYNSYAGCRASALMALSGVVKQGGLMILITPTDEEWKNYIDPEIIQQTSEFFRDKCLPNQFVSWLISQLADDHHIITYQNKKLMGTNYYLPNSSSTNQPPVPYRTTDQQTAVLAIVKMMQSKKPDPIVITADRGRGKSASLGIAASQLMSLGYDNMVITGPNPWACERALDHCKGSNQESIRRKNQIILNNACTQFIPFDEIIKQSLKPTLLIIDEAAALPVNVLKQLLTQSQRIVFCSTIHGYEGSGRGFELRFKPYLNTIAPNWQHIELTTPIRWYIDDALEQFWFKTMLFTTPSTKTTKSTLDLTDGTRVFRGQDLVASAACLYKVFNLLINAHYQTSPDDLQRLLTCPEYHLIITIKQQDVIGAALLVEEPNQLQALSHDIIMGKRRIKGFLTAQTIGFQHSLPSAFEYSFLRIVRIAVRPDYRRQGIGSDMLNHAKAFAQQANFDFLSTSFGLTPDLLNFWHAQQFSTVNIGIHKDQATGEYSGLCLFPIRSDKEEWMDALIVDTERKFQYQLARDYQLMDAHLVASIIRTFPSTKVDQLIIDKLNYFVQGQRPLAMSRYELATYAYRALKLVSFSDIETGLLVGVFFQNTDLQYIAKSAKLTGKKDIERTIRELVSRALIQLK